MKRIDISLAIAVVLSVLFASFASFADDCGAVRQNIVRLHILANSDSEADQNLKLAVRDKILAETQEVFIVSKTKKQAEAIAAETLNEIERIARAEIIRQGYHYSVRAEIVNMFFETRSYGDATLPAGRYDAVRVSIGAAKGKNWWCVLFPPLCIPAASEKDESPLEEQIKHLGETPHYVPKLAILELIENIQEDLTEK